MQQNITIRTTTRKTKILEYEGDEQHRRVFALHLMRETNMALEIVGANSGAWKEVEKEPKLLVNSCPRRKS